MVLGGTYFYEDSKKSSFAILRVFYHLLWIFKISASFSKRPTAALFIWVYDNAEKPLYLTLLLYKVPGRDFWAEEHGELRFRRGRGSPAVGEGWRGKSSSGDTSWWPWTGSGRRERAPAASSEGQRWWSFAAAALQWRRAAEVKPWSFTGPWATGLVG